MVLVVVACAPDAASPAPAEPCEGAVEWSDLRVTLEDFLTAEPLPDATLTVCGEEHVTDDEGAALLRMPLEELVEVRAEGLDDYPVYRFLFDMPDAEGWAWLEEYVGGTVWLPKRVASRSLGEGILGGLGYPPEPSLGGVSIAVGPDTLHPPATSAEGASATLDGVSFEGVVAQTSAFGFDVGATLGVDDGVVYFVNVEPGDASFTVADAEGDTCGLLPSFSTEGPWPARIAADEVVVAGFMCR